MFTKNVVRTLGVVVGISSLVIACQPDDGASVSTKGGIGVEGCLIMGKDGTCEVFDGTKDLGGTETKGSSSYKVSWCDPIGVEVIANAGEEKFFGNTRLAPVINGRVPCIDIEKGEGPGDGCAFNQEVADKYRIPYVKGKGRTTSLFAMVGTQLNIDGSAGGNLVVASKVYTTKVLNRTTKQYEERYSVDCLPPTGADTAGTTAGTELAGGCVVETLNSAANAAGVEQNNYCKLEVCAKVGTNAGADAAGTAKTSSVTCWKGEGAGLNDPNGTERDPAGVYYAGIKACHRAWSSTDPATAYEVAAAKRPSTGGYPPKVIETSPMARRPVVLGVAIGNP